MAQMTERMKELFDKVPTVVLSTVSEDGTPNAVPVGSKKIIDDETILMSDQFFNKTLANMKANPRVGVTFWEGYEGYQFKGIVTIETRQMSSLSASRNNLEKNRHSLSSCRGSVARLWFEIAFRISSREDASRESRTLFSRSISTPNSA